MAKWSDFHPYVHSQVQGCPISVMDTAIKSAAIELCEKSLIWQRQTICGDLVDGERRYTYANPREGISLVEPIKIIIRKVDEAGIISDYHLTQTNRQDLDTYYTDWRKWENDIPRFYYMEAPNTIIVAGTPTRYIPDGIHVLAAIKPTRNSVTASDMLLSDWADVIADGALAKLHAMMGKQWANTELVSYHTRKFRAGISRAKSKQLKSWIKQSKTMLPKSFFSI